MKDKHPHEYIAREMALRNIQTNLLIDSCIQSGILEETGDMQFRLTPEFADRLEKGLEYTDNTFSATIATLESIKKEWEFVSFSNEDIADLTMLLQSYIVDEDNT